MKAEEINREIDARIFSITRRNQSPRKFMVWSTFDGVIEDEEIFDTRASAERYAEKLAKEITESDIDPDTEWEIKIGVVYVFPDRIEGSQFAGEEPELLVAGKGRTITENLIGVFRGSIP